MVRVPSKLEVQVLEFGLHAVMDELLASHCELLMLLETVPIKLLLYRRVSTTARTHLCDVLVVCVKIPAIEVEQPLIRK